MEVDSPEEDGTEDRRRNMGAEEQEADWLTVRGSVRPTGAGDSREEEGEDRKTSGALAEGFGKIRTGWLAVDIPEEGHGTA